MPINENKLINVIKECYEALKKNGEIGPNGFDYFKQLEFYINLYETLMNKNFDLSLLETL